MLVFAHYFEIFALIVVPKGGMEVAPSVNEILIRTSPECLCSRMRNMKKWGRSGVIYCLLLAGLILVIIVARRVLPSASI